MPAINSMQKFTRLFLILTFLFAQLFTQQLHELTHHLTNTDCEADLNSEHSEVKSASTFESPEHHKHCQFLRLISAQNIYPFLAASADIKLKINLEIQPQITKIDHFTSYNDHSFHNARAPPVA